MLIRVLIARWPILNFRAEGPEISYITTHVLYLPRPYQGRKHKVCIILIYVYIYIYEGIYYVMVRRYRKGKHTRRTYIYIYIQHITYTVYMYREIV